VPLGALIGDFAGWRWAFGGMALLSGLVLALHLAGLTANLWLAGGFAATALLLTLGVGLRDRRGHDALRSVPTDL